MATEAVLLAVVWLLVTQADARTRNAVIFLGDDVGFESSVYGNKICKTPNIQNLADRGLVFDKAYTTVSSCSPSRASLLTGLPCHQNGMYGLENGNHHFNVFDQVETLPNILNQHNIFTGIIGKKHVGPYKTFNFDYSQTEMDGHSITQVGRNITLIKILTREFLQLAGERPFLLYVAFHDAHRCGHTKPELGVFCEKFGDSSIPGMGSIPDWKPQYYTPDQVEVPYFVPNTPAARQELSYQYTTISRLDQGVGLVMSELSSLVDHTLIIYTSDNGIPFPSGRTNLYEPGIKEPFILSNPYRSSHWGKRNSDQVTLLDVLPTILDWFNITYPKYHIFKKYGDISLTGNSLLRYQPTTLDQIKIQTRSINESSVRFASQSLHEITMFYPMRVVYSPYYKLIHNTNYKMPFPIDQDFYLSKTFQDILNRTKTNSTLPWYKTLHEYYYRPRWQLYFLPADPTESNNLYENPHYAEITDTLKTILFDWMNKTNDPFLCFPDGVLEDSGNYKHNPQCMPLYNFT